MREMIKIWVALVVAVTVVAVASPAVAQDAVSLEVRSILATVDGDEFDPRLDPLRGRLERGFSDYSSFRQLDLQSQTVERGQEASFDLPTDDTLLLTYNGRADEFVKLGLVLESRLSTTLRATPGSTFFQAGLRHEDGMLILAITVE